MNRTKVAMVVVAGTLLTSVGIGAAWALREPEMTVTPRIVYAKDLVTTLRRDNPWIRRPESHDRSGLQLDGNEAHNLAYFIFSSWDESPIQLRDLLGFVPKRPLLDKKWFYSIGSPRMRGGVWHIPVLITAHGSLFQHIVVKIGGERGIVNAHLVKSPKTRVRTLNAALELIDRYTEVQVVLPTLGDATFVELYVSLGYGRPNSADLRMDVNGRELTIQYGDAGFDGCGEGDRRLEVAELPATAQVSDYGAHLIWPTTMGSAIYGLYGDFPLETLVEWAEDMEAARRIAAAHGPAGGC